MRHSSVRQVVAALSTALALVAAAACSSTGSANYPDRKGVVAAQGAWCDMLDKLHKEPGAWTHAAECKAAFPTASGPFLKGMAKCFFDRVQRDGDSAPDNSQIVEECDAEAVAFMVGDESSGAELVEARCKRMERCEKVNVAECKSAIDKLDAGTRAQITTKYNGSALHQVAECLGSASCTDDEDAARSACYKPVSDKLLWFP